MNLFFKLFKWNWYWKSLKLLSSILLIGFFGLWVSSFVNWYDTITNCYYNNWNFNCLELSSSEMFVYWNYTNSFEDIFNFKDFDWQRVFTQWWYWRWWNSGREWISSFFWSDWNLYWIIDWTVNSFYPLLIKYNWWCVVDSVVNSDIWSSCWLYKSDYSYYTNSISEILEIFDWSVPSSYLFLPPNLSWVPNWIYWICAKYNDLDKSLCFYIMWNAFDSSRFSQLITEVERWKTTQLNWVSFYSSQFWLSPFAWWWNWWDSSQDSSWSVNDVLTWSYIYTNCTYQALIDYMESVWASKYLCYWWLDNFNLYNPNTVYNPIPWTWKTLAQILAYSNTWDTPLEWYNFWNWLRWWYVDMWSSYPAVYKTWFDIYYQYWWNSLEFDSVREYCSMILLDIDFSNTVYRWQYFKKTCEYIQRNNIWIYDWSWNVVVWVNWWWIWNYTWVNLSWVVVESPVWYIQNFFNELKANFPTRNDLGGGALPVYIITFLCAVALFRFLRH